MRLLMLFAVLLVAGLHRPRGEFQSARQYGRRPFLQCTGLDAPDVGDSGACPGGFARSSQMQDFRDGTQELFCD